MVDKDDCVKAQVRFGSRGIRLFVSYLEFTQGFSDNIRGNVHLNFTRHHITEKRQRDKAYKSIVLSS